MGRIRRDAALAAVLLAGVAVVLVADPAGRDGSRLLSGAVQTVVPFAAGFVCLATARRADTPGVRTSWRLFAVAAFAWAAADAVFVVEDLAGSPAPLFPAAADIGFLALLPLAAAALLLHPAAPETWAERFRVCADAMIAGGSVLFITRALATGSAHRASDTDVFDNAAGVAYALGDVVVLALALLLALQSRGATRSMLAVVALGFSAHGVADALFTHGVLEGTYETGSPIDVLWMAGFTGLLLAARVEHTRIDAGETIRPTSVETVPRALLPYAVAAPAFVVGAVDLVHDGRIDRFLVGIGVAVSSLVLVRQFVDRVQNIRLVLSLTDTVEELRDRDAQLAEAQSIASLGSWSCDVPGQRLVWSEEMYRVYDLDPWSYDPSFDDVLALVHADDRPRFERLIRRALESGDTFEIDHRIISDPARVVHVRGRAVLDDDGELLRVSGTCQDVTTVRTLSRELERRLADLERSNADLAHFASVTSHDLAAPIQLLLGHLRLLRDQIRAPGAVVDPDLVDGAIRGAHRLEELIQDILSYSLATASDEELRSPVDTARVVREAARTVGAAQRAESIEIDDLPVVEAHPGQMRQLFQNLLSNAVKFVPAGRTPRVRVWADDFDGVCCFNVADNGIGVPERDRERVFQMFERGGADDISGTGIGLAICSRIVSRHGGRIWIEPGSEGGSVVRFTLGEAPERGETRRLNDATA